MKPNNLIHGLLALIVAVISTNAQERSRGDREQRGSDAQWAREAMERYRGSGRVNPLDPEAVKRRLDYAIKEGLMTREQAEKLQAAAKKRMEVAQREDDNRRGRGRETQSNDRQADARKGYEIRRKRIEEGIRSGKIKREDAAKMYAELRKRMEAANRGGGDKKEEGKEDPRLARYRATERHFAAEIKAGKLSKEDAQKKLIEVRKQLWNSNASRSSQSKKPQPKGSSRSLASSQGKQQSSSRGYLGASVESSSKPKGLRIQQVYANTAAARAKLKKGDIIVKMNGASVTSSSGLIGRLSKTKPGQKATLLVSSGGKTKTVQVQLGGSYSTRPSVQSGSTRSRSSSSPSRSSQAKNSQSRDSSRSRTPQRSSGTDWRKAIEERMKKAREDRERAERNSRGRGDDRGRSDRGEDMRKAMEERMKQWRESRERDGGRDGRRPEAQRGPQGRGPQPGGSWRGGPGGRGPQSGGSWRGGPGGRGPQSGGPGRGGPRGR